MASHPPSRSLTILNTIEKGTGTFPQSSKLPPELRYRIWEQCLCQERMVQIELVPGSSPADMFEDELQPRKNQEHLARNTAKADLELSGNYFVVLRNRHEISKLFRVSVESRQAAKRFYRVQIPCYYKQLGSPATEGVFYFSPELDILNINTFGKNYLLRFARLLRDHDPLRIGLVNLALLHYSLRTIFDDLWKTEDEEFMRQFLSGLRRVYLGYSLKLGRSVPTISTSCESFTASTILRSRPLMASVSRVQRHQQDPRAIDSEMKRVFMGSETRVT